MAGHPGRGGVHGRGRRPPVRNRPELHRAGRTPAWGRVAVVGESGPEVRGCAAAEWRAGPRRIPGGPDAAASAQGGAVPRGLGRGSGCPGLGRAVEAHRRAVGSGAACVGRPPGQRRAAEGLPAGRDGGGARSDPGDGLVALRGPGGHGSARGGRERDGPSDDRGHLGSRPVLGHRRRRREKRDVRDHSRGPPLRE